MKLNDCFTDWFDVTSGVRQGDNLSPTLFGLFINNLAIKIKALNKGVVVNNVRVGILLYADDIVLLAENETDLQDMINCIFDCCQKWRLFINHGKTKIIHFRSKRSRRSDYIFKYGEQIIEYTSSYKYLGVIFNEFMNFTSCADALAESSGRALGGIIAKFKLLKDVGYKTFTKMFEAGVVPIMDYGAGVWGFGKYPSANVIQNRASRYFMGVHSFAPNPSIHADMGWLLPRYRRYLAIVRLWNHLIRMDSQRLTKQIFEWDYTMKDNNWSSDIESIFDLLGLQHIFEDRVECDLELCKHKLNGLMQTEWETDVKAKPKLKEYI